MDLVAGVQLHPKERIAETAVDDVIELCALDADADRSVPLDDRAVVGATSFAAWWIAPEGRFVPDDEAGAAVRAPPTPYAVVKRSPSSIRLELGLGSPMRARGPLESMRWQERGIPFSFIRRTASCSVIPGARPKRTLRIAADVWVAAYSNQASCSASFTTRRPSSAFMKIAVSFVTLPSRVTSGGRRPVARISA
jgi:hypothetical protein